MTNEEIINAAMMFERLDPSIQEELLELMREMANINAKGNSTAI